VECVDDVNLAVEWGPGNVAETRDGKADKLPVSHVDQFPAVNSEVAGESTLHVVKDFLAVAA
jgi:hypothetical protein